MDSPYWKGPLPGVDVQRRLPVETFRAQAEQHSGGGQKVFGFSPESMLALRPESCSESARNPVRLHPGMLSGLPRNTHLMAVGWYLRFSLSYRDVEELLQERGMSADHVTVARWVQRYAPNWTGDSGHT